MHVIFEDVYLVHHLVLCAAAASQFEVVHALLRALPHYYRFVQREALEQLQTACVRRVEMFKCGDWVSTTILPNGEAHSVNDQPAEKWKKLATVVWLKFGKTHRDNDLPALQRTNGHKEWWQHGKRHRDNDCPAIEYTGGGKEWHRHGALHRGNDLPAVVYGNGTKIWYRNDQIHRAGNLPAIEWANGDRDWYNRGFHLRAHWGQGN